MKIDNLGRVVLTEQELFQFIYDGNSMPSSDVILESNLEQYRQAKIKNADQIPNFISQTELEDYDIIAFDNINQKIWFMPNLYKNIDIEGFLVDRCPKENYDRLIKELQEYRSRNLLDLLRFLKYLIDTCQKENILCGLGRGSSAASYVLYLLGIHKVDPIKYKIPMTEFFK